MSEGLFDDGAPGVLDLSGADTTGFDPVPPSRYEVEVWEAKWDKTKPDSTGALGPDFPYINVQFKIVNNEEFENRRVFNKYFPLSPEGYDPSKAAKNQGGFVNFLTSLGYSESEVKSSSFALDLEELKGKGCIAIVSRDVIAGSDPVEYQNNVKGVKPLGAGTEATSASQLL